MKGYRIQVTIYGNKYYINADLDLVDSIDDACVFDDIETARSVADNLRWKNLEVIG